MTALGGAVLPWQDALHEGPVPAVARPDLRRARAAFLSECGWGSERALLTSLEDRDSQLVDALREGVPVVAWFEHDLYDQLQLLEVLSIASDVGAAPELIVADSFPGEPHFRGLGELKADELETLWPTRRVASVEALAEATVAWDAFRAAEPEALAEWVQRGSAVLPLLTAAMRRLLEELPSPSDGLSGSERRALRAVEAGACTPGAAFVAAQRLEEAPFMGDAWFYRVLAELGHADGRLVETEAGDVLPSPPPLGDGHVFAGLPLRLTGNGERVLRGEADRVDLVGVDRWVGGTHITPEAVWRWDPTEHRLIGPSTR